MSRHILEVQVAYKDMKYYYSSLTIREIQIKSTEMPSYPRKVDHCEKKKSTNASKDVGKKGHIYTAGKNVN